jgi:hypothetical protein
MHSHVKVLRVIGVNEETKGEEVDILENYTFDLTLDEQPEQLLNSELFLSGQFPPFDNNPASNTTVDQVDDLLAELNELVGYR